MVTDKIKQVRRRGTLMPEEFQWKTEDNEGRKEAIRKGPNLSIIGM